MADIDKFVNIADLKAKLRYWCKTRGMTKAAQDSLMETIKRIPYTVKADIVSTLETDENEIEMLRNQLEIAHAKITRLESKYEGIANKGSADNGWIPVDDALPEHGGLYLAYFTFKDGRPATDLAYINTGCNLGSITHWMPLPEPPEKE